MPTFVLRGIFAFLLGLTLAWAVGRSHAATTILPPGATCFQQATGPVSSGSVYMLVPATTTPKSTWQDSAQSVLNTNPIQLDANGCAVIYGAGSYRQQVYTGPVVLNLPTGTLLYDVVTTDTSAPTSVFWAGLSGGTANAITLTDAGFANTAGAVINFIALNSNTAATTISVSGGTPIPVQSPTGSGPTALSSGCIIANNPVSVVYSATASAFLLLTPCTTSTSSVAAISQPQGYLSLSSDTSNPIITADVSAATSVYYTAFVGGQVPIWNGTAYIMFSFTQLVLALSSGNLGNTLYDICVFSNSGVPTLVTGPAWTNSAAGAGSRGTGAGTTQLQRINGLWVNAVQITGNNGASSFTVPSNQCTFLGTILIDQTAGQVSAQLSFGQNRKWGVWNAYNRQPLVLQVGDPTTSWTYNSITRASNGTSGNAGTALTGLAEDSVWAQFTQTVNSAQTAAGTAIGVGFNSTSAFIGQRGTVGQASSIITSTVSANYLATPTIGTNVFNELEQATNGTTPFLGTINNMLMTLRWRG